MKKPPFRLLMTDDEQTEVKLFQSLFEKVAPDVQVQGVLGGGCALALLKAPGAFLPDIILLDLNMPEMDGYAVLSAIKTNPALRHLTVVVSNAPENADIQRAYRGLARAYLVKPATAAEGLEMVKAFRNFWHFAYLPRAWEL